MCGSGATEESAPQNCEHLGIFRKDSQGTIHADKALQKILRQKSSDHKSFCCKELLLPSSVF